MDAKLFDTLLEPVFILNQEKKIVYCNEPAGLMCDLSPRKIVRSQTKFDELFQFTEAIESLNQLDQVDDATPYQEVGFTTTEQKSGKVQITLQPFPADQGEKTWIVFFRDVTLEETLQKKYRAELEQKEDVILDLQKAQAELEKYSKNLEKMVDERTTEIRKLNQMMAALLDSLHQGFFIFDRQGACLEVFSKACEVTVETKPKGQQIWDVLKLSEKQVPGFQRWMTTVFSEMLPFEDLAPLGPQKFPHSENLEIQLEYYPLRNADSTMEGIVVVATDITKLVEAQRDAEKERAHAKMIVNLIQQKRQVLSFLQESKSILDDLKLELAQGPTFDAENLFRCLHTLKGGAATFSIKPMADQAHESETLLTEWKSNPSPENFEKLQKASLKVETHFLQFSEENVQILGSPEKLKDRWVEVPAKTLAQFETKLPPHLKAPFVEQFLMEPIGDFFQQYVEMTASVAERESKAVEPLVFHNSKLPILPEIYSQLFSTFIHAYRNAVDHGIEYPHVREEAGKPATGRIETTFHLMEENQQSWLQIEVQDDGNGVDANKIREKLKSKGFDVSNETDQQVLQHLFDSQFSTKEVVTETSGRGVGMDAILHASKNLGGFAWVESTLGKGTTLKVKVPYLTHWSAVEKTAA